MMTPSTQNDTQSHLMILLFSFKRSGINRKIFIYRSGNTDKTVLHRQY